MMTEYTARPLGAAPNAFRHPRRHRAGPQLGEVRVRHRQTLLGSPHLRRQQGSPPGQHSGHFGFPNDCMALQRFIGMIHFYRCFLPRVTRVLQQFTSTLAATKVVLIAAVPLAHPLPRAILFLVMDASNTHVGVVVPQKVGHHWQPLGFYSQKLSKTKVNYSTFDRELLAAVSGIKHFRSRMEGRPFQLWTGSRFEQDLAADLCHQQCHLAFVSEYTSHLVFVPGTSNVVPDALSHPAAGILAEAAPICAAIAVRGPLRPSPNPLPKGTGTPLQPSLQIITQKVGDLDLIGNAARGTFHPLVPRDLHRQVFDRLHGATNPSM
jgi:hypothetical protein